MFAHEAEKSGVVCNFNHEPGTKAYIDVSVKTNASTLNMGSFAYKIKGGYCVQHAIAVAILRVADDVCLLWVVC